jgi:hypothetical protein
MKKKFETEDALLSGTLEALGCKMTSFYDKYRGRVKYRSEEDVTPYLERLERDEPCGSLTQLQRCKIARSAIFSLKIGR